MRQESLQRSVTPPTPRDRPAPIPPVPPTPTKVDNTWGWMIFWIFVAFIGIIIFSVYLVLTEYPVELDNQYPMDYHTVDERYNDLQEMSREFDRRYQFAFLGDTSEGVNRWRFSLQDQQGHPISGADIRLLVTREATTTQDIDLGALPYVDGYYETEFNLPAGGTWLLNMNLYVKELQVARQFVVRIPVGDDKSAEERAINARERVELLRQKQTEMSGQ